MRDPQGDERRRRQEREANIFAAELLMPRIGIEAYLDDEPDIAHALAIHERFDVSKQAALRRYVDLHPARLAVIFSKESRIASVCKPPGFPSLKPWVDDVIALLQSRTAFGPLDEIRQADPAAWLTRPNGARLQTQTLFQQDDRAATLLVAC